MIDSTLLDVRWHHERRPELRSELEDFKIYGDDDDQIDRIRADLDPSDKAQLKNLMEQYRDIFTWSLADMSRIDINVACHKLLIDQSIKHIQ